jgi:hypothetical protein
MYNNLVLLISRFVPITKLTRNLLLKVTKWQQKDLTTRYIILPNFWQLLRRRKNRKLESFQSLKQMAVPRATLWDFPSKISDLNRNEDLPKLGNPFALTAVFAVNSGSYITTLKELEGSHCGGPCSIPGSGHVGFVVDKVALWWVFSEYFTFPLPITIP